MRGDGKRGVNLQKQVGATQRREGSQATMGGEGEPALVAPRILAQAAKIDHT